MGTVHRFIAELKRRRVFRALVVWGVLAFAVLQVYEPVMHGLRLPEWTLSFVVVVLGLGFPVTAALAWTFDLTSGGIERTPDAAPAAGAAAPAAPGRVLLLLGVGLAAAAPGLVYFFVWPGPARRGAEARAARPGAGAVPSIAVLPFVNLSSDKEQEYFSDGIAEEILNSLAQLDGLRVIGRTSSFAMKGRSEDLRAIGRRLDAATLLEGSVRKAGTRVRITAQLVESAGGTHLWSQEFDRDLTDVFAVQEEIARAVVAALQLKVLPGARPAPHAVSPEAHDLYLQGLSHLARGSGTGYTEAVAVLQRAVDLQPDYAQAWAALSRARYWAADQNQEGDTAVEWAKARQAAEQAIALAPDLADGYVARALHRQTTLRDWDGARADLEKARALSQGTPLLMDYQADLLATLGRLPEALALLTQAARLDPLSADVQTDLAIVQLGAGRLPQAEGYARRALELSQEHGRAARTLGFALLLEGRPAEAQAAFHRSTNPFFRDLGDAMVAHAQGRAREGRQALDRILALPSALKGSYQIAEIYAWRGEVDLAFTWLSNAEGQRDPGLTYLKYDPLVASLRVDPRYAGLLRRLNLPAE